MLQSGQTMRRVLVGVMGAGALAGAILVGGASSASAEEAVSGERVVLVLTERRPPRASGDTTTNTPRRTSHAGDRHKRGSRRFARAQTTRDPPRCRHWDECPITGVL